MMMSTMPEPSGLGYRSIMSLSSNSLSLSSSSILVPSQHWCMPGVEGGGGVAIAPSSSSYIPLPPRGFASAPPNPKTSLPLAAIINAGAATKNAYTQQQDQAGNLQEATIDTTSPRGGDTIQQQPQHPTPAASRRAEVASEPRPRCCFSRFTSLAEFELVRKFLHHQQEEETADNVGATGANDGAGRYMKHHLPPCGRGGGAAAFVNASHLAAPHLLRRRSAAGSSSSSSFLPSASTASGERSVSPQLFEMQAEEDE